MARDLGFVQPIVPDAPKSRGDPAPTVAARERLYVLLALLSVYFIWGSTYFGIRLAVEDIPPFLMAGARFVLAGGILLLVMRLRGAQLPTWRQWANSALLGLLLMVGGNGLITFGEALGVSSGFAATVVAGMPLLAALWSGVFGHWPQPVQWVGLSIGFVGIAVLSLGSGLHANLLGLIAVLASPISWSLGSVLSKQLDLPKGLISSGAQMFAGGIALLMTSFLSGERLVAAPGLTSWLAFAYLTVFGSLIAYSAYMFLLEKVSSVLATSYAFVNPVVAVILGALLGEAVTANMLVALPLVLVGIALITWQPVLRTKVRAS